MTVVKCPTCKGQGYEESPAYYYGRAECGTCQGVGVVKENGDAFTEEELDAFHAEQEAQEPTA